MHVQTMHSCNGKKKIMKTKKISYLQAVWMDVSLFVVPRQKCAYLYSVGLFDKVNLLMHFVTPTYILSGGASQNATHVMK